jgi:hypothetical protein
MNYESRVPWKNLMVFTGYKETWVTVMFHKQDSWPSECINLEGIVAAKLVKHKADLGFSSQSNGI